MSNNTSENFTEKLMKYLQNLMSENEKLAFEIEIENDSELQKEVLLHQKLLAAIEVNSFLETQKQTSGIHTLNNKHKPFYTLLAVAAIIAVAALGWWMFQEKKQTTDTLYSKFFRTDPGLPVAMSSTSQYIFYDGMISYKEGKFDEALNKWESIYQQNNTDTLQYYIGLCYLNNNNVTTAIEYLSEVSGNNNSEFQQKAIWYLALCHLKSGAYEEAKQQLLKLKNDSRSEALLAEIENIQLNPNQ